MEPSGITRPAALPRAGDALPKRAAEKKDKPKKRAARSRAAEPERDERETAERAGGPLDLLT
jgi:hypothetical protein